MAIMSTIRHERTHSMPIVYNNLTKKYHVPRQSPESTLIDRRHMPGVYQGMPSGPGPALPGAAACLAARGVRLKMVSRIELP
jgi:hypothetical protein